MPAGQKNSCQCPVSEWCSDRLKVKTQEGEMALRWGGRVVRREPVSTHGSSCKVQGRQMSGGWVDEALGSF